MSETLWIRLAAGAALGEASPWARLDAAGRVLGRPPGIRLDKDKPWKDLPR